MEQKNWFTDEMNLTEEEKKEKEEFRETPQYLDEIKGWIIKHKVVSRPKINNPNWKKELYDFSPICNHCKKYKEIGYLELDHIIPFCLGGENTRKNTQLLCITCHRIKTSYDKRLFHHFRELGWIEQSRTTSFVVYKREILDKWV